MRMGMRTMVVSTAEIFTRRATAVYAASIVTSKGGDCAHACSITHRQQRSGASVAAILSRTGSETRVGIAWATEWPQLCEMRSGSKPVGPSMRSFKCVP